VIGVTRERTVSEIKKSTTQPLPKLATGIEGFDAVSHGGLPRHCTTLVVGGPGAGKTVFALQTLVNGARHRNQSGIFVAFEEASARVLASGSTFDWGLAALVKRKIFLLDAQLSPTVIKAGDFDLIGMLAVLAAKKQELGAEWIVFDGLDVLLTLLRDPLAEMREIYRIRDWLAENALTALVTAKADNGYAGAPSYGFMQFMVDCVVRLEQRMEDGVGVHRLRITKYRGSDFASGEFPVSFGQTGLEVGAAGSVEIQHEASTERISAGFDPLDAMLGGGLFRGSSTLITGQPGTAKTTLAGTFIAAACERGERALFVSFDEGSKPIARNLSSVGIKLAPHVKSGMLRMYSARTEAVSAEDHLIKLRALIREHRPSCMVIDPLSAIARAGTLGAARAVANRLMYMIKDERVTVMMTALTEGADPEAESTALQISTIADTWINLSYVVRSGERNRALTIVKSRGTWHSNQVRELILSASGPSLTDVYTAGGEVLMGTLRWERESEDSASKARRDAEFDRKRRELEFSEADTVARIKAMQMDLQRQQGALAAYARDEEARLMSSSDREGKLRERRSADPRMSQSRPDVRAPAKKNGKGASK